MVMRTIDAGRMNERQQLQTLAPHDVSIVIAMGDITTGSFDRERREAWAPGGSGHRERQWLSLGESIRGLACATSRAERRSCSRGRAARPGAGRERYVLENPGSRPGPWSTSGSSARTSTGSLR
jgi:hypothetical protein